MSIVFDEIITEVNAPSTENLGNGHQSSGEEDVDSTPGQNDLSETFERLQKRQLRLFAD